MSHEHGHSHEVPHEHAPGECRDLLGGLADYLDGDSQTSMCAELKRHMEGCSNCRVVVNTASRTVQLFRGEEPIELSPEFHARLHGSLREAWMRKFGKC